MAETTIIQVAGRRIWDSRGRPTVEVEITLADGVVGTGMAPAGASRGSNEALELRDGGTAFGGFGVGAALAQVEGPIRDALIGQSVEDQAALDAILIELDGTALKQKLGGNAMCATSLAALRAAARAARQPVWRYLAGAGEVSLPLPEIQIFGGGAHAGRRVDIQDFMIMPVAATSFDQALANCAEIYRAAGELMAAAGQAAGVADEGGWWPAFETNEMALEFLVRAIERAGFTPGDEVAISLDVAASEFHRDGRYRLGLEARELDRDQMIELLIGWVDKYPIVSLEDPLTEDDRDGMRRITAALGDRVQIIGDDYLVTNAARIAAAAEDRACNAALIKFNQAGTITETKAALDAARAAGWGSIVSARSGETEDVTITHLAVGWNAGQLKVGSFARSERMAKWNEGLRIAAALGPGAPYAGPGVLPGLTGGA